MESLNSAILSLTGYLIPLIISNPISNSKLLRKKNVIEKANPDPDACNTKSKQLSSIQPYLHCYFYKYSMIRMPSIIFFKIEDVE